ncbi:unnamed protein product [Toxocara canis]|uniref:Bestrophin homolog n=1 Tax=Toxocara canis TaxID=6265 RepID=A0A183V1B4_TOXCA|nr:unnamed protein product [Toxocara canis]
MTVSYHLDLSSSTPCSFLKILFRWRGSIWKSVATELFVWTVFYYKVELFYRSDWILNAEGKRVFEAIAELCNQKLDYIPMAFMLGFFVNMVVDRWKKIFANMGWIENQALFVSTYIRGNDPETRIQRRNIVRYICLSQVLVFRDISMRVRRRFPTMQSVMKAGFLLPHELEMLEAVDLKYNKYFVPFNWIFAMIYKLRKAGKIDADVLMNSMLQEIRLFRTNLAELCNYDWVPVPLAYPQVVFLAVRVYFIICLVARQFIVVRYNEYLVLMVNLSRIPHTLLVLQRLYSVNIRFLKIDLRVPFMTMLQFVFYMGWVKVAESLLNPMGEDDDDFEGNFLIDKNIATALRIVDGGYDNFPEQKCDSFMSGQEPLYSTETAKCPVHQLVGSVASVRLAQEGEVKMVPHEPEPVQCDCPSQNPNPRWSRSATTQRIRERIARMSLTRYANDEETVLAQEGEVKMVPHEPEPVQCDCPSQNPNPRWSRSATTQRIRERIARMSLTRYANDKETM